MEYEKGRLPLTMNRDIAWSRFFRDSQSDTVMTDCYLFSAAELKEE